MGGGAGAVALIRSRRRRHDPCSFAQRLRGSVIECLLNSCEPLSQIVDVVTTPSSYQVKAAALQRCDEYASADTRETSVIH
jgi:hypothetical protein